ncbi:MAG: TetR family transcriptional regulator [Planctomycetes bacterium]|nr:TetR family transcriptional regulator [Planctomycetota bacterium]
MAPADTKQTILDAAEELLAEQGYAATSLRQLTARAGVNLAAVHYHFGGKEALAKAVLARRIAPINAERLRRLAALPAGNRDTAAIVRAFVEPPLRAGAGGGASPGARLCRVFGRVMVEQPPFLRAFLARQFRGVARRFEAALADALPGLDRAATWWRLHFVIGAMAHTLQNSEALSHLTGGACDAGDVDALIEHLVAFATGGLRAPTARRRRRPA